MAKINVTIKTPEWDTVIRYTDHDGRQVQESIYGTGDTASNLAQRALDKKCSISQVTTIRGAAEEGTYGHNYGHAVLEIPRMYARYSEGWQEGWRFRVGGVWCEGYGGIVEVISAETGKTLLTYHGAATKTRPAENIPA